MPTGYTAFIEDGKITNGKDFLKLCIRAFGVCADQREEPLSITLRTQFGIDDFYQRHLENIETDIKKYESISDEELYEERKSSLEGEIIRCKNKIKQINERNELYSKIRSEIKKWVAPTSEHNGIKEFALEQIDISIENTDYVKRSLIEAKKSLKNLSMDSISEIRRDMIAGFEKDRSYYQNKITEERNRIDSRNLFMKQFLDSLNAM